MQAKAEALKDEINRRFPTGTRRWDFGPFAASWTGWHATSGNDHYLSVGQIPSPVWYCGPWDVVGDRAVQRRAAHGYRRQSHRT